MVRECIQGSPILIAISRNNTYDMGVRAHDDPSVACQDTSPFAVGDDAGDKIDLAIEIKS